LILDISAQKCRLTNVLIYQNITFDIYKLLDWRELWVWGVIPGDDIHGCNSWISFARAAVDGRIAAAWLLEGADVRGTPVRLGGKIVAPRAKSGVAPAEGIKRVTA